VAGDVADDDEQSAVAGGLDVEEVAADLGGGVVDGVDSKPGVTSCSWGIISS